jgi:hypothetical protein
VPAALDVSEMSRLGFDFARPKAGNQFEPIFYFDKLRIARCQKRVFERLTKYPSTGFNAQPENRREVQEMRDQPWKRF